MSGVIEPGDRDGVVIAGVDLSVGGGVSRRVDAADPAAGVHASHVRRAWVRCVDEVHLGPLEESALLLDEAAAMVEIGEADSAMTLLGLAAVATEEWVGLAEEGGLPGAALNELRLILRTVGERAAECAEHHGATGRVQEWVDRLVGVTEVDDALSERRASDAATSAFLRAGGTGQERGGSNMAMDSGSVDTARTPPRLVVSQPAGGEVLVEFTLDGDDPVAADVSVALARGVDPDAREVTRLRLMVFDSAGQPLSVAALDAVGRMLATRITNRDVLAEASEFAVVSADAGLARVRRDGPALVEATVDRLARHAWTSTRLVRAGAADPSEAASLIGRAVAVLTSGIDRHPGRAEQWSRRREALLAWADGDRAAGVGSTSAFVGGSPADRPLLAELLGAAWDE